MQASQSSTSLVLAETRSLSKSATFTNSSSSPNLNNTLSKSPTKVPRSLMDSFYASHKSSPQIGFGTSTRPPLDISTTDAPGPGAYSIKTTMLGNFPESKIRTAPQFSLRSRERFGSPMTKSDDPTCQLEPGPGHYKQIIVNSNEMKAPAYTLPKSRWIDEKARMSPGPGAYNMKGACEKQVLSTKANFMPAKFGKGVRPSMTSSLSDSAVGPGEYGAGIGACDRQVDSRKKTFGNMKFAISDRSPIDYNQGDIPGPGTYKMSKRVNGRATSMSGREKFGGVNYGY